MNISKYRNIETFCLKNDIGTSCQSALCSGTNMVWISTTHAIKAMRKIGVHDIAIEIMNHPEKKYI